MRKLIAAILVSFATLACIPAANCQSLTSDEMTVYKAIVHKQYALLLNGDDRDLDKVIADVASYCGMSFGAAQDVYSMGLRQPLTEDEKKFCTRLAEALAALPKRASLNDYDRAASAVAAEFGFTREQAFEIGLRLAALTGKPA